MIRRSSAVLRTSNDARHIPGSARLLQRMLALNISRFEPNPLQALEQVGRNGLPGGETR
jgi:hypothetical protein